MPASPTPAVPVLYATMQTNILGAARLASRLDDEDAVSWLLESFLDHADKRQVMELLELAVELALHRCNVGHDDAQICAMSAGADEIRATLRQYLESIEGGTTSPATAHARNSKPKHEAAS